MEYKEEVRLAIKFIESHGDDGFIKNEHGQYIYKAGPHGFNLPYILADFLESAMEEFEESKSKEEKTPLLVAYYKMKNDLSVANKEIESLKEKEIRGDRMILDLEHSKIVLNKRISELEKENQEAFDLGYKAGSKNSIHYKLEQVENRDLKKEVELWKTRYEMAVESSKPKEV